VQRLCLKAYLSGQWSLLSLTRSFSAIRDKLFDDPSGVEDSPAILHMRQLFAVSQSQERLA
jgi:hypothetical protein